jgi:hypothetical protein
MQTLEETVCFSLFSLPPASVRRSRKPRRKRKEDMLPVTFLPLRGGPSIRILREVSYTIKA